MELLATLVVAGFAVWMGTLVLVEGEIFRDFRELFDKLHNRYENWLTYKLRYLVGCHLCTGIWVAAIASLFIPPLIGSGFVGWGLTALAIKGVGHLILVVQKLGEAKTRFRNLEADDVELMTNAHKDLHRFDPDTRTE